MKIIKTKNFPPGTYKCINLFGVLFTKSDRLTERGINHEGIHTDQMEKMLYIGGNKILNKAFDYFQLEGSLLFYFF